MEFVTVFVIMGRLIAFVSFNDTTKSPVTTGPIIRFSRPRETDPVADTKPDAHNASLPMMTRLKICRVRQSWDEGAPNAKPGHPQLARGSGSTFHAEADITSRMSCSGLCKSLWLALLSAMSLHAGDSSKVDEGDIARLKPRMVRVAEIIPWLDGVALHVSNGWVRVRWPELKPVAISAPANAPIVWLGSSGQEHYLASRQRERLRLFQLHESAWGEIALPKDWDTSKDALFLPTDKGVAFSSEEFVYCRRDDTWKKSRVSALPDYRRSSSGTAPLGSVQFIQYRMLYASTNGGEFGSDFARYDLDYDKGSWTMLWKGGRPVTQIITDQSNTLWSFATLWHRMTFTFSLQRHNPKFESILGSMFNPLDRKERVSPTHLQSDSAVTCVAPMPDGRIALMAPDEGIYTKAAEECPRLIEFSDALLCGLHQQGNLNYVARESTGSRLCFDHSGNAYVMASNRGVLVFHQEGAAPWRVRQIEIDQ